MWHNVQICEYYFFYFSGKCPFKCEIVNGIPHM